MTPEERYDSAMANRSSEEIEEYGQLWTPWDDLTDDERSWWVDLAES